MVTPLRATVGTKPGTIVISRQCVFCGEPTTTADIPEEGFHAWRAGELIQNAMPEVSEEDRDVLVTAICPPCMKKTFPDEE